MKKILLSATLLLILAMTIVPTYAFVIPPNISGEDFNYELYGPHIPGIKFLTFANQPAELTAMSAGALDLEDTAFTGPWVPMFGAPAGPWTEAPFAPGWDTAFQNQPVEGVPGNQWVDLVNQANVGVGSWWSTLDMHVRGETETTPYYVHYGLSTPVDSLNILYAFSMPWGSTDIKVLSRMYDCGALLDPYTLGSFVPQLYKSWVTGTWLDPGTSTTKTYVNVTLRPDIYWQDGHPFTVADVYYTLVELSRALTAKLDPMPTGPLWPAMGFVQDAELYDDYNMQILLNTIGPLLLANVLENVIIPKHIWKPIVDASSPGSLPSLFQPDADCIGTGPFRYSFAITPSTPGGEIDLVANTPGSVVNGITSPGYYFYYPIYVDISPTSSGGLSKINIKPSQASVTPTITITTRNMYLSGSPIFPLTGNKYVFVNSILQAGYPRALSLLPMARWDGPNPYPTDSLLAADVEIIKPTFNKKTLNFIEVDFQVTGPPLLPGGEANPWIGVWIKVTLPLWVTIKEDIVGTTLYDVLGYTTYPYWLKSEAPAPDLRVDGKDIAYAAMAYGTIPGNARWSLVADVSEDYRVDGADIAMIALQYGY